MVYREYWIKKVFFCGNFAAITSIHLLIANYKSLKYKYKIVNHRDYTQIKIAIILCDLENYRHFLN